MKEWIFNQLAWFMSRYLMPDYEAHKRAARMETSANEVYYRREMLRYKKRAETAEKHVRMFMEVSDNIVKDAMQVDDGEMTPFVHKTVVDMENARRYVA